MIEGEGGSIKHRRGKVASGRRLPGRWRSLEIRRPDSSKGCLALVCFGPSVSRAADILAVLVTSRGLQCLTGWGHPNLVHKACQLLPGDVWRLLPAPNMLKINNIRGVPRGRRITLRRGVSQRTVKRRESSRHFGADDAEGHEAVMRGVSLLCRVDVGDLGTHGTHGEHGPT